MLIERQSVVAAPAEQVWQRVVTPEGINDELRPWMTMSVPRGAKGMTVDTVPIGAPIGRAWLRLFGVLPFDYDRLSIAELEPGRRFREDSTMLSMRQWQHERTVTPEGDTKTIVRDRITFQTRAGLRFAAPLIAAGLRALGTGGCSDTSLRASGARGAHPCCDSSRHQQGTLTSSRSVHCGVSRPTSRRPALSQPRWLVGAHRRQFASEPLDLDQDMLAGAAVGQ